MRGMPRHRITVIALCMIGLSLTFATQRSPAQSVNVTTWQQETPAIPNCTGCVFRTGQNLSENTITVGNISKTTFGQLCSASLDGQVYGQPLVVTNVMFSGQTQAKTVVYVVTQNNSAYAFDGTPGTSGCTPLLASPARLLHSTGATPVDCANVGGGACQAIAPNVGLLGTPVINAITGSTTTGTIYIVSEEQTSGPAYAHYLWALDITSLTVPSNPIQIAPPSGGGCPSDSLFSQHHIQRPALLLAGGGYLYVAFSMMDGTNAPLPNGVIFAYNTGNLSALPLCLPMSQNKPGQDGAGIWMGGAGPAYGPDGIGSSYYTYFTTANGVFDLNQSGGKDAGDSFIKMSNSGTPPALSIKDYFTPIDQKFRSDSTCGTGSGDVDFGSGGPMLIPPSENTTTTNLSVHGEKEGGMWFLNLQSPGGYGNSITDTSCNGMGSNTVVQNSPISGSYTIHTNPAFWESGNSGTNYMFIGSQWDNSTTTDASGELLRYQICGSGQPINGTSPCTTTGVFATDGGQQVTFPNGATPSVTAASASAGDAIVWAIWSNGDLVPNTQTISFMLNNHNFTVNPSQYGKLYAFKASTMSKLYSSDDCMVENVFVDRINPATKFSVPTVANGYVYLGTMGARCQDPNMGLSGLSDETGCYNSGTFYIFGPLGTQRGACH